MEEQSVGQILISEPFMEDPNFKQSVVLICDFEPDHGTVGFILNKPLDVKVHEIIQDFPEFEEDVYLGGPVGHDTIHYVHTRGDIIDESVLIRDGLWWGGDFDKVKFLIDTKVLTGADIKFFVGYSGWSIGQLDGELEMGSWVVDTMDNNYLLNIPSEKLWKSTLSNISDNLAIIANIPDNLNLN